MPSTAKYMYNFMVWQQRYLRQQWDEENSSVLRLLHCPGSSKSILDANLLDSSQGCMLKKNAKPPRKLEGKMKPYLSPDTPPAANTAAVLALIWSV